MINLALVVTETVLRGGQSLAKDLEDNYLRNSSIPGLSVIFHPGFDVDALARSGHFKHRTISYATVAQLEQALQLAGYGMELRAIPSSNNPDHHSLLVVERGHALPSLPTAAAQALASEFGKNIVPNPYQQP